MHHDAATPVRRRPRGLGLIVLAAVVVPVAVTAYRRRPTDYTRCPEFRAIVGDYLI